jgi:hypothetical protein
MVDVVRLGDGIHDGELQRVREIPLRLVLRTEMAVAEEEQDVRGLRDRLAPCNEEWRREGRAPRVLHEAHHRRDAAAFFLGKARDVDVVRAAFLEREAHELAASLDLGPVVQKVFHGASMKIGDRPHFPQNRGQTLNQAKAKTRV